MPSASFTITTTRTPADAFAYVADARHATDWMGSLVDEVELVAGEPGEIGARFLVTNERKVFDDIVVDYKTVEAEPGARLVYAVKHPKLEGTDSYRLTATGDGGTEIEYLTTFEYTGLNKVATPLGAAVIKAVTGGAGDRMRAELDRG